MHQEFHIVVTPEGRHRETVGLIQGDEKCALRAPGFRITVGLRVGIVLLLAADLVGFETLNKPGGFLVEIGAADNGAAAPALGLVIVAQGQLLLVVT
jgi:hypothetical protein